MKHKPKHKPGTLGSFFPDTAKLPPPLFGAPASTTDGPFGSAPTATASGASVPAHVSDKSYAARFAVYDAVYGSGVDDSVYWAMLLGHGELMFFGGDQMGAGMVLSGAHKKWNNAHRIFTRDETHALAALLFMRALPIPLGVVTKNDLSEYRVRPFTSDQSITGPLNLRFVTRPPNDDAILETLREYTASL